MQKTEGRTRPAGAPHMQAPAGVLPCSSAEEALLKARELLSYLPSCNAAPAMQPQGAHAMVRVISAPHSSCTSEQDTKPVSSLQTLARPV